jgi:hypothetical protein
MMPTLLRSEVSKRESYEYWLFAQARRVCRELYGRRPGDVSTAEWKKVWRHVYEIDRRERECAR